MLKAKLLVEGLYLVRISVLSAVSLKPEERPPKSVTVLPSIVNASSAGTPGGGTML